MDHFNIFYHEIKNIFYSFVHIHQWLKQLKIISFHFSSYDSLLAHLLAFYAFDRDLRDLPYDYTCNSSRNSFEGDNSSDRNNKDDTPLALACSMGSYDNMIAYFRMKVVQ